MLRRYQRPNMPPSCKVCIAALGSGVSSTLSGTEAVPARVFKLLYLWLRHFQDEEIRALKGVKEPKREVCRHETPRLKARSAGSKEDELRIKQNLRLRIGVEAGARATEEPCILVERGGRRKTELLGSWVNFARIQDSHGKMTRFQHFNLLFSLFLTSFLVYN